MDDYNKATLTDALTRYLHELRHGDADTIAETGENLDKLWDDIHGNYDDEDYVALGHVVWGSLSERSPTDAETWCRAALLILGTL